MVHGRNDGVVVVQMFTNLVLSPRKWREQLIANELLTVIEWMERLVVLGQRNLVAIVQIHIFLCGYARIMWIAEGQVHEDRPVALSRFQKSDRFIDDRLARLAVGAVVVIDDVFVVVEQSLDRWRSIPTFAVVIRLISGGFHRGREIWHVGLRL